LSASSLSQASLSRSNPKQLKNIQTGIALQRAGKHQEAVQDFKVALTLKPNDSLVQLALDILEMSMGKLERRARLDPAFGLCAKQMYSEIHT
jgi:Flp pilus assembly protein TadD